MYLYSGRREAKLLFSPFSGYSSFNSDLYESIDRASGMWF